MDGGDAQLPSPMTEITEGEWAGWRIWSSDAYELLSGPFYCRRTPEAGMVCAFRAEAKHMNGGGFMHGGCLMTFADYAMFCIGHEALTGGGSVTASLSGEFLDAGLEGERIEARGEVTKGGRSLVFIRGKITAGDRALLTFTGIVKKTRRKTPAEG